MKTAQGTILDDDRDVTPPTIVSVTAPAAGNYVDGDSLTFTVKFSEAIDRTTSARRAWRSLSATLSAMRT